MILDTVLPGQGSELLCKTGEINSYKMKQHTELTKTDHYIIIEFNYKKAILNKKK